ncbi:MAG TPA: YbhB/YbcL family Raf kinase inhibitor-like protein [Polyangiaceae bacterium]|nr:YbhB/YbcL family Raf kinase inhibitor-like protein [Polyangiaceae bacterium]
MSFAGRFRVGCVSSSFVLFALACSSESPPGPAGTGGTVSTTGGTPATGGSSTGGTTGGTVSTGGSVSMPTGGSGGSAPGTGGSTGGNSTGGISTSGGAGGTSSTGGTNAGGNAGAGGTQGGAASTGGAGGKGATGGAGGKGATGGTAGAAMTGGAAGAGGASGGSGGASGFTLTSPAWTTQPGCAPDNKAPCGIFPKANTGLNGGKSESPELNWSGAPSTTQSYAIILQDLTNVQQGNPFIHWVMWNIPADVNKLPAGLEKTAMPTFPPGSSQRSYSGNGYVGSGKCGNVYEFLLFALPMASISPGGTNQTQAATAIKATNAPTASLRARSGAPECTE